MTSALSWVEFQYLSLQENRLLGLDNDFVISELFIYVFRSGLRAQSLLILSPSFSLIVSPERY